MNMLSLSGNGQSFEDKLHAVRYFISGQAISYVVLKATTSELLGPKKKHLNYLVAITNEPNVPIPKLVKCLMRRAKQYEWPVAFKALITIHYLMSYGNERFIQNLASSVANNRYFDQLASFLDESSDQAHGMSTFLRRYSRYVSIKITTYRSLGLDFCKINSHESPIRMRNAHYDQLLKMLPILQNQFDLLMAFDATTKDLNNGIINAAFNMLYKDFVKLYIAYQAAIIKLLELFFANHQVKQAQALLEAYKKFLVRMDKVSDFMRVIDSVGMDKSDMPNVSRAPNLTLRLLESHLCTLESVYQQAQFQKARSSSLMRQRSMDLPRISSDSLPRQRSPRRSSTQFHRSPELTRFGQKRHAGEVFIDPDQYNQTYSSLDKRKRDSGSHSLEEKADRPKSSVDEFLSDPTKELTITTVKEEEPDLIMMNEGDEQLDAVAAIKLLLSPKAAAPKTMDQDVKQRVPNDWVQVEL